MSFTSDNKINSSSPVGQPNLPGRTQGGILFPQSAPRTETMVAPELNFSDWSRFCDNGIQNLTPSPDGQQMAAYSLTMTTQAGDMMAAQYQLPGELESLRPLLDFNKMAEQPHSAMVQVPVCDLSSNFDFNSMPPCNMAAADPSLVAPSTPPCEPFELPATPVKAPIKTIKIKTIKTALPAKTTTSPVIQDPSRSGDKIPPPSADQPRNWKTWAPWINSLTDAEVRKLETRQLAALYYSDTMTEEEHKMTTQANARLLHAKNYKRRQINNAAAAKSRRKKVEDRDRAVRECEREKQINKQLRAELEHTKAESNRLKHELARVRGF